MGLFNSQEKLLVEKYYLALWLYKGSIKNPVSLNAGRTRDHFSSVSSPSQPTCNLKSTLSGTLNDLVSSSCPPSALFWYSVKRWKHISIAVFSSLLSHLPSMCLEMRKTQQQLRLAKSASGSTSKLSVSKGTFNGSSCKMTWLHFACCNTAWSITIDVNQLESPEES